MPLSIAKNTNQFPDWMLKVKFPNSDKKEAATAASVSNEKDMVSAKNHMEKCAKEGKPFYFEKEITDKQKKELEEYAEVCKMDKKDLVAVSKEEKKIASERNQVLIAKKAPDKDPFKALDGFAKPESFEKNRSWEKVEGAKRLGKSESTKSIVRADGVETDAAQREVKVKTGENSIYAPDSIEKAAKSTEQSSRQKTIESNQKRKDSITFKPKEWDKEQANKVKSGIISKPGVKLTGADQGQSHSQVAAGQHSIFDKKDHVKDLPEKTAGENLKQTAEKRKQEIQRPKTEDRSWDQEKSSEKPVVSDVLYEELKKKMAAISKGKK